MGFHMRAVHQSNITKAYQNKQYYNYNGANTEISMLHTAFRSCHIVDWARQIWSTPSSSGNVFIKVVEWINSEKKLVWVCPHVHVRSTEYRCSPRSLVLYTCKSGRSSRCKRWNKKDWLSLWHWKYLFLHCPSQLSTSEWFHSWDFLHHHLHRISTTPPSGVAGLTSAHSDWPSISTQHSTWQLLKKFRIPFGIEYSGALKLTTSHTEAFLPASFSLSCFVSSLGCEIELCKKVWVEREGK